MSGIVVILFSFCLAIFGDAAAEREAAEISTRIYGGREVDIKQMPFMASLFYYNEYICSGAIVEPFFILTAAHCVAGRDAAELTVRVGSSRHDSGGSVHQVDEVMLHPSYNDDTHENDVAVLFLYDQITIGDSAKVIGLGSRSPKQGESVSVAGWGSVEKKRGPSDVLRAAAVTVISKNSCERLYRREGKVGEKTFCAADPNGNADTCGGDSGGPAVQGDKVVGITSWGKGCGQKGHPGVYTDVAKVRVWIKEALATYN